MRVDLRDLRANGALADIETAPLVIPLPNGQETEVRLRVPTGSQAEDLHRAIAGIGEGDPDASDAERVDRTIAQVQLLTEWGVSLFVQPDDGEPFTRTEIELLLKRADFADRMRALLACAGLNEKANDLSTDRS